MSDESWFDNQNELNNHFDGSDVGIDCIYGLTEFCDNPILRYVNNCFQCETYLNACKKLKGETEK